MTANTNEKILMAAAELFAAHGYSAVSTKDIAKRAGVNESTLFRQFGDKRKIFFDALRHHLSSLISPEIAREVLADSDFEHAIKRFARLLVEQFDSTYVRLTLVLGLEFPGKEVQKFTEQYLEPIYREFAKRIAAEQRAGNVRKIDPMRAAMALGTSIYGYVVDSSIFGEAFLKPMRMKHSDMDVYVEMWLASMRASKRTHSRK